MATDKVEKETPTPVDYEAKWKAIQQEFADFDGDEFANDPLEETKKTGEEGAGDKATETEKKEGEAVTENGGDVPEDENVVVLKKGNPEDDEMFTFSMPNGATFLTDMSRYRHQKKLYVHPLTQEDLYHTTVVKLTTSEDCLEYRIHFYRDNSEKRAPQGLLTLFFSSNDTMDSAMTELKKIREDLIVETHETKDQKKLMPLWNRKSKEATGAALKTTVLCVCNVPHKVTAEKLVKFFPSAKDVIIPVTYDRGSKIKPKHVYAYAIYDSEETADAVVKQYEVERPAIGGAVLGVYKYKEGGKKPQGLLSLTQRKLVLKHGAKAATLLDKIKEGEEVKSEDAVKNKLKRCVELTERDNEARRKNGLTTPSYERLIRMKTLPVLNSKETQRILSDLHVIPPTTRRHTPSLLANSLSGKKQQKKLLKKTVRKQGRRVGGLLGGMPGYGNMGGYGYGGYNTNQYGFNMYGRGYGMMGGYGNMYGNGYRNGKLSQSLGGNGGGNVRPLMDSMNRYGQQSYQQTNNMGRRTVGGVAGMSQTSSGVVGGVNHHMMGGANVTGQNQYNNYNQGYGAGRDGRNVYDRYSSPNRTTTTSGAAAAGGDSWYSSGYGNERYF